MKATITLAPREIDKIETIIDILCEYTETAKRIYKNPGGESTGYSLTPLASAAWTAKNALNTFIDEYRKESE